MSLSYEKIKARKPSIHAKMRLFTFWKNTSNVRWAVHLPVFPLFFFICQKMTLLHLWCHFVIKTIFLFYICHQVCSKWWNDLQIYLGKNKKCFCPFSQWVFTEVNKESFSFSFPPSFLRLSTKLIQWVQNLVFDWQNKWAQMKTSSTHLYSHM